MEMEYEAIVSAEDYKIYVINDKAVITSSDVEESKIKDAIG